MRCHVCNVAVGDGQRFCHKCGEAIDGVTETTGAHDVIVGENIDEVDTDDTVDVDVVDDTDDTDDTDDDSLIDSETVSSPAQSETDPPATHRGTLPDVAEPPVAEAEDATWWVEGSGEPAPADLPDTEPVEVVGASPPMTDDDALAPTEATAATPRGVTGSGLGAIPFGSMDETPDVPDVATHEPTATMPATAVDPGRVATDEFPPSGIEPTSEMAVTHPGGLFDGGEDVRQDVSTSMGFRLRASFVFAILAMATTLMASVADVIDISTSRPVGGIPRSLLTVGDLGSNLVVAGFVGATTMLVGGLLSCFGLRWAAGVAGGAGLSMAGWSAVVLGLAEQPIFDAEAVAQRSTQIPDFTLTITRDIGYLLILAIGILGLVVFVVSLRMAGTGGRGGLDPWIAAVGALAAVVLAAGPLITLEGLPLDVNLASATLPLGFHAGRLVQLGLLVVTGVLGFLSVRPYGLGLAAGGLAVSTWMWITTLAELGNLPRGIAVSNLGPEVTTTHAVTTVGMTASLALLLIAITVATVTRRRA